MPWRFWEVVFLKGFITIRIALIEAITESPTQFKEGDYQRKSHPPLIQRNPVPHPSQNAPSRSKPVRSFILLKETAAVDGINQVPGLK